MMIVRRSNSYILLIQLILAVEPIQSSPMNTVVTHRKIYRNRQNNNKIASKLIQNVSHKKGSDARQLAREVSHG